MRKFNLKNIMLKAWKLFRSKKDLTFAEPSVEIPVPRRDQKEQTPGPDTIGEFIVTTKCGRTPDQPQGFRQVKLNSF